MTEQEILDNNIESKENYFYSKEAIEDDGYINNNVMFIRSISDIETIVALRVENESLKAQLETKNKAPSHWDTAPEGAVKLVECLGCYVYLNVDGKYFDYHIEEWCKDPDPDENILIDERTL